MIRKLASILCLGLLASAAHANEGIDTAAFFSASLTGLDGQPVVMEKFRGRPLIVNFWARWCGPCREEIPELVKLRAEQAADGIEVIGVAIEALDKIEAVRDFAKAYDMSYPVVLAAKEGIPLMKALGNPLAGAAVHGLYRPRRQARGQQDGAGAARRSGSLGTALAEVMS